MSARRQIIAALSEDSYGGIATLHDVTHAEQLVDAHRAEVLAADGQAYDGELAMLRSLVRTIAATVGNGSSQEKQAAEVRQLLAEHAGDEAHARLLAIETAPGDGDPDFFQPHHTYQRGQWQFACLAVKPITWGNGETRAVGYLTRSDGTGTVTGLDPDDWSHGGWTDVTEAGDERA